MPAERRKVCAGPRGDDGRAGRASGAFRDAVHRIVPHGAAGAAENNRRTALAPARSAVV